MSRPHIAYCFLGHLRTFREHNTLMTNLIGPNPGDVFMHTYSRLNAPTPLWHGNNKGCDVKVTAADIDWIRQRYPVVAAELDPAADGSVYAPSAWKRCGGRWSVCRVNELRRRHEEQLGRRYDIVFLARFDLMLLKPTTLVLPEPQTVYGSHDKLGMDGQTRLDGDVFLYGSSDAITALTTEPFPPAFAAAAEAGGFEGERVGTAMRKAAGLQYRVHRVRHGLLRPGGSFMSVVS